MSKSVRFKVALAALGSLVAFQNCSKSLDSSSHAVPPSQSEALTSDLLNKSESSPESELLPLAEARQKLLLAKLKQDPAEVLRLSISPESRVQLSENLQAVVEKRVEVEGELLVLHVHDNKDPKKSHYEYEVHSKSGEKYLMHLSREMKREILSGEKVRVKGLELVEEKASGRKQKHLVVDSSDEDILILGATSGVSYGKEPGKLPYTFGEQKSLVILINFSDNKTEFHTKDQVLSVMSQGDAYFREASYGQTWLNATVVGYLTIAASSSICDRSLYTTQARQAALNAGYDINNYDRILIHWPVLSNCGWGGLGTVGGKPSYVWSNGGLHKSLVVHEMGHNLGLFHAHSMNCGATILGSNCKIVDYGDPVDTMGNGANAHFNAYHKDRLGWLGSNLVTVSNSSSYTLAPYEFVSSQPLALKIVKDVDSVTGTKNWYYLEYRQAIGQDSGFSFYETITGTNFTKGLMVHMGEELKGNNNYVLDMSPETSGNFRDGSLTLDKQYSDSTAGVLFKTRSVSGSGAAVDIILSTPQCVQKTPLISLSTTGFSSVDFGSSLLTKVKVTNANSLSCAPAMIDLSSTAPSGFSAQLDQSSVTLASGQAQEINLVVQTPSSASVGSYNVIVNAQAATLSASAQMSIGMAEMMGVPPVATDDLATTGKDQAVTLSKSLLVGNDVDADMHTIYLDNRLGVAKNGAITAGSISGSVTDIIYTPKPGFTGTDRFKYMIKDLYGGYDVAEVTITVGSGSAPADTVAPSVSITSPSNGASVSEIIAVSASASDDVAVSKVEFYVDGVLKLSDTSSPYSLSLDTKTLANGSHTLMARAYDSSNNSNSAQISVNVSNAVADTTLPSVSITAPSNGATVSSTIAVSASASDNVAVSKVEFYVDGVLKLSDISAPYSLSLDTKTLANGSHTLMAKAYDGSNNSSSAQISVNVSNSVADTTLPTVSITSPTSGAVFSPRTAITLQASASDNSSVNRVEFYVNGSLICSDSTASYSCAYKLPGAKGVSYLIEARAYDSSNNIGSHKISIGSSGTGGKGP